MKCSRPFSSIPFDVVIQSFGWAIDALDSDVHTGTFDEPSHKYPPWMLPVG
jgi:hypothetical protein